MGRDMLCYVMLCEGDLYPIPPKGYPTQLRSSRILEKNKVEKYNRRCDDRGHQGNVMYGILIFLDLDLSSGPPIIVEIKR